MESLSDKRRRAGRLGAAARWGNGNDLPSDGNSNSKPWRTTRPVAKLRQGRNDWFRIENRATDESVADVYIYDEIGYFGVTAADFVGAILDIDAETIALHLNTPGGDVFDGIAIYNALRQHPANIEVTVDALAASAGSFIAMAGDKVVMTKNASLMIHDAHGLAIGNAVDMRELADLLDRQSDNIASIYAERAGGSIEEWRAAMQAETWYSADEAVKAGLADEVQGAGKGAKNTFDLSIYSYAGRDAAPAPTVREPAADIDVSGVAEALKGAFA